MSGKTITPLSLRMTEGRSQSNSNCNLPLSSALIPDLNSHGAIA